MSDIRTNVTLLVTAFGPFPGMPANPSMRLVARLARQHRQRLARLGIRLVTAELPVVFAATSDALRRVHDAARPDAVIHVGVAGRRSKLSIETRALNRIGTLRTDAARRRSAEAVVIAHGAAQLAARWPAHRLVAALQAAGSATGMSRDAGDYVCNQCLYLTLARTDVPAGFLHIPDPRAAAGVRGRSRRPTLQQMVDALARAAVIMAMEVRRLP